MDALTFRSIHVYDNILIWNVCSIQKRRDNRSFLDKLSVYVFSLILINDNFIPRIQVKDNFLNILREFLLTKNY